MLTNERAAIKSLEDVAEGAVMSPKHVASLKLLLKVVEQIDGHRERVANLRKEKEELKLAAEHSDAYVAKYKTMAACLDYVGDGYVRIQWTADPSVRFKWVVKIGKFVGYGDSPIEAMASASGYGHAAARSASRAKKTNLKHAVVE